MSLFDKVSEDIKAAMLAKDKIRLQALRGVKKEFLEAKTAKGGDGELNDEAAVKIIQKMVKQRKESAEIYTTQGRPELAEAELAEVEALEVYLPKQLTPEELETELKTILAEVGAEGPRDMGKVMGAANKALAGKAEGRMISEIVRKLLNPLNGRAGSN
ncbi:MAG: GatB/YqeY domain-containing protein [Tannerellaceae bacterium]|nr:GatB/YqeY domain-containing protein [Tannerellaceae bacterium]